MQTYKFCSRCRTLQAFSVRAINGQPAFTVCNRCTNKARWAQLKALPLRERRNKQKENPISAKRRRHRWRFGKYGLAEADFATMLNEQNHQCAICGISHDEKPLTLDHDHNTEEPRGLLCGPCNRGIGQFRDNVDLMHKAIDYLTNHKTKVRRAAPRSECRRSHPALAALSPLAVLGLFQRPRSCERPLGNGVRGVSIRSVVAKEDRYASVTAASGVGRVHRNADRGRRR